MEIADTHTGCRWRGVGGIIPARLLEQLYAQDPRLLANADIVAGTSTGGLIALGLARGKSPAELCQIYQDKARDIFSRAHRRFLPSRLFRAKFKPDGLREAVREVAGDLTLGQLTAKLVFIPVTALQRSDISHRPAGIFLSTAYQLTGDPTLEKYQSSKWKCVDAALATAAAPTFFPAHEVDNPEVGKWTCWDGGIVANNPALAAAGEVFRLDLQRQNTKREGPWQSPDVRVLSLGTGYRNIDIDGGDRGIINSVKNVVAALMDTSVGSTSFLLRQVLGERAIRVSVPLKADYDMDDPTVVDSLNGQALEFARNGLSVIRQPDGTNANLHDWLNKHWY